MAQMKPASRVFTRSVEALTVINKELSELLLEFGQLDLLKPPESYLLGAIRTLQASCTFVSDFASELLDRSKPPKPKTLDPIIKEE